MGKKGHQQAGGKEGRLKGGPTQEKDRSADTDNAFLVSKWKKRRDEQKRRREGYFDSRAVFEIERPELQKEKEKSGLYRNQKRNHI